MRPTFENENDDESVPMAAAERAAAQPTRIDKWPSNIAAQPGPKQPSNRPSAAAAACALNVHRKRSARLFLGCLSFAAKRISCALERRPHCRACLAGSSSRPPTPPMALSSLAIGKREAPHAQAPAINLDG